MNSLHIGTIASTGADFRLPLELVTTSSAILAKKRVGKSYTSAVFTEELMKAGQPVVIIDITGAHWGLKASADEKTPGFPVVIFGGKHADVPLEENAGAVVARAIVEKRFCAILDFSSMSKAGMQRVLLPFFQEVYRLNELPLHIVCDEADRYAPQQPQGSEIQLIAAMDDIVSRGGIKGIGVTIISQRSAKLNKNILTQCELLIVLRIVHPLDAKAVMEWVEMHATPAEAKKMLDSLPTLPIGTAWFWWPNDERSVFDRVQIRKRITFDSGATPKPGAVIRAPKMLAQVDVQQLGADIAATVQRAKDNDPAALKMEVARLKAEVAKKSAPVAPDHATLEAARNEGFAECRERTAAAEQRIQQEFSAIKKSVDALDVLLLDLMAPGRRVMQVKDMARRPQLVAVRAVPVLKAPANARPQTVHVDGAPLSKAERRILTCLAQFGPCSKNKIAAITGYAVTGGGFCNGLSALRTAERIAGSELLHITLLGDKALGAYDPRPTGPELVTYWESQLSKAEAAVFRHVCAEYPAACTKEEIAAATGYEPSGGGFNNALSRLRTLELITRGSDIRASENLFS